MPIVSDKNGSVYVEYHIPKKIRNLMDRTFLIEFRNQLYRIFDYWALDSFDEEGISMNTGTAGWAAALGKACINTHKESIYAYWKKLDWYDSDIFDGELANILLEEKVVLGSIDKYIEEYLGIKSGKIRNCCDCFGFYEDSEVVELSKEEAEEEYSAYRCKTCEAIRIGKISKKDAKHNDLNERLKPFLFDIISKDLSIDKQNLVKCSKCGLIYSNDLGINTSDNFLCHYCNDASSSDEERPHATDYYRNIWKEIDSIDWSQYYIEVEEVSDDKR